MENNIELGVGAKLVIMKSKSYSCFQSRIAILGTGCVSAVAPSFKIVYVHGYSALIYSINRGRVRTLQGLRQRHALTFI